MLKSPQDLDDLGFANLDNLKFELFLPVCTGPNPFGGIINATFDLFDVDQYNSGVLYNQALYDPLEKFEPMKTVAEIEREIEMRNFLNNRTEGNMEKLDDKTIKMQMIKPPMIKAKEDVILKFRKKAFNDPNEIVRIGADFDQKP